MGYGTCRLSAIAFIALAASFFIEPTTAQTVVQSPDQLLAEANKASGEGNYQTALAKAREARSLAVGDLSFATRYVLTLTDFANVSDIRHRSAFFNEALKAANEIEVSKAGNGTQDAEFSWNYMVAIGGLADSVVEVSKTTSQKLRKAQAKIAQNLKTNPGFPRESLALLADHVMAGAYAHAIAKDADATATSIQAAFDSGFTNFEPLLENNFIEELKSEKVNDLIEKRFAAYKAEVKKWARDSIAKFPSFDFRFDVADIEAGRIRHGDFRGRILVLDLWATWCPPCREAIPHFVKLDEEFRGENVDIVGISMDNPDDPGKSLKVVRNFIDESGVEYAVAMGNRSVMNQLAPGQKLPTVLFIDTNGKVRYVAEGPHNYYQLEAITNELIEMEKKSPTSFSTIQNGM